jgi:hypothetical protein
MEDRSSRNKTGACRKTEALYKKGVRNSKMRQEQQENRSSEEETGTAGRQKLKETGE